MNISKSLIQAFIEQIQSSRKYRGMGVNPSTIEDLIRQEAPHQNSKRKLLKAVRRKMHNIIAPYLGNPDYDSLQARLAAIRDTRLDSPEIRQFCLDVLETHASTAERIPIMKQFYSHLFRQTGKPDSIQDLACGLNPFAFPWMGLPLSTDYQAYDIVQPRIDLINTFFNKIGLRSLAENRDIFVSPPEKPAALGFFFKEAHRLEKRQSGSNRRFWCNLQVDKLVVSLPAQNLDGTHSLQKQHRTLVRENLPPEKVFRELQVADEMIFIISQPDQTAHD